MTKEMRSSREVSRTFFRENPRVSRKLIRDHSGDGFMYTADTRVAFVNWLDSAARDGRVSQNLAQVATLDHRFGRHYA